MKGFLFLTSLKLLQLSIHYNMMEDLFRISKKLLIVLSWVEGLHVKLMVTSSNRTAKGPQFTVNILILYSQADLG